MRRIRCARAVAAHGGASKARDTHVHKYLAQVVHFQAREVEQKVLECLRDFSA